MAASFRRTLTSTCTLTSRCIHPSFSHLLPNSHDRDQSTPPPINQQTLLRSPFPNAKTHIRDLGFSLPLGLRSYSSSSSSSSSTDRFIDEVADVLPDSTIEISSSAAAAALAAPAPFPGEVAAAAADSFPPVAALQHLIDAVHSFTGFNWWASIALTTLLIRGVTVPLMLNQLRSTVKLSAMRPEMEELKEQMNNSMDPQTVMENQKKIKALFKKHGVTPFSPLMGLFIQGPIFISFFMAISNMVEKVPSFKGGGVYWFTDLTTPDPFYALPILTGLTFLATVELNMQDGLEGNPIAGTMKKFSRGLAVLTVPFTASFPKAIFCYWITSNLFSLIYGSVLKLQAVRKFLKLPDIVPQSAPPPQPNLSFLGSPKSIPPNDAEPIKAPERRISSSSVMSQRIRNLEKQVKSRNKPRKK